MTNVNKMFSYFFMIFFAMFVCLFCVIATVALFGWNPLTILVTLPALVAMATTWLSWGIGDFDKRGR